ncbi:Uncharacterized membrane protein [Sphingobacterium nematocida]|uniref:Uncharacterized membrane protein n=1 Tax=Sphingobacterium nematocida TaxID=1513896 RepID=A0A1T5GL87_9SPHI|nr:DUF1003 domain-containing protein [Sphingobacterium nematocida]SKC09110.1 Uncharacterized membrane protein [Sphingobacterium nematocida]
MNNRKELDAIIERNNDNVRRLHEIVKQTMVEEALIVDRLVHPPKEILSRGQRVSDKVAQFGGSWRFIIIFIVILVVWIAYNTIALTDDKFDPYPFILMNLVLSCVAALQAPIIMMSQNRQEEKDRMRGENDYLVNLKAELEIRSLHQKLDVLLEEQIKGLYESQQEQYKLIKELYRKVEKLDRKLNP